MGGVTKVFKSSSSSSKKAQQNAAAEKRRREQQLAAERAAHEKLMEQKRIEMEKAQEAARRLSQQQVTLQNISTSTPESPVEVARELHDADIIGGTGGRRRRGARLSAVLGI